MSAIPPSYYKWAQIDEICSCGERGAVYQRKFEILINQNLSTGLSLQDSRIEALKILGKKRTCCLREFTLFPKNFICSATKNSFVDITRNNTSVIDENMRGGNNSHEVGWEFLPKTNNVHGFNLDNYCLKLSRLSTTPYKKIHSRHDEIEQEMRTIAQFPNYITSKAKNQLIVNCNINPLSNEELTLDFLLN